MAKALGINRAVFVAGSINSLAEPLDVTSSFLGGVHGTSLPSAEPLQQLRVYATEATVAEYAYDLAALHAFGDMADDRVHIGQVCCVFARGLEVLHEASGIKALLGCEQFEPRDLRDDDGV